MLNRLKQLWVNQGKQAHYWKWLFTYAKPFIPKISLTILINLLSSVLSVAMAILSKQIIDIATASNDSFVFAIILYVAAIFASIAANVAGSLISLVLAEKFSFGIRKKIYEQVITAHWLDTQQYHTGDLMTRLTSDATNISDGIVAVIPDMIKLVLELIIVFFTLFYYSPLLAVFALILGPLAALGSLFLARALKRLQIKVQQSESAYRSFLQESIANLLVIKSFSNEEPSIDRLTRLRDNRFYWVFKRNKMSLAASSSMSVAFQIGYIVAFSYGAVQISKSKITYGTMSVFLTLVNRVQAPVMQLAQHIPQLVAMIASAERVAEIQSLPKESRHEVQFKDRQLGLRISGLTYGYGEEPVLQDICAEIKRGELAGIVGESGIGKTTLVRLLMGFMSDYQGTVHFYDGQGKIEEAGAGMRNYISYVPQGNTLFSGTIRDNILMGKLGATDEEIQEAVRLAGAQGFLQKLPQGIDTVIGERGHGLSEGQAQRIAIARALIKKAPVLILDEATSALDEETELWVLEGVCKMSPRPTCLFITHRRSVLNYCDKEIVIRGKQLHILPVTDEKK